MAYLHQPGWTAPTGSQIKSSRTTIDEESLELFKSIVAEKAAFYERCHVAEIGKRLADEIKALRTSESLMPFDDTKAWRRRRFKRATTGQR
jgi:hypothetical protein